MLTVYPYLSRDRHDCKLNMHLVTIDSLWTWTKRIDHVQRRSQVGPRYHSACTILDVHPVWHIHDERQSIAAIVVHIVDGLTQCTSTNRSVSLGNVNYGSADFEHLSLEPLVDLSIDLCCEISH